MRSQTRRIYLDRHYNVRKHESYSADVPVDMLNDERYFDADGYPTSDFDQWMCDNGHLSNEATDVLDNDDLEYEVEKLEVSQ